MSYGRNYRHSNTSQGLFPRKGYSTHSQPHYSSSSRGSGHDYNTFNNYPNPDKPTQNRERNTDQDKIHILRQALKPILDYYHKNKQISGGVDESGIYLSSMHWKMSTNPTLTRDFCTLYTC